MLYNNEMMKLAIAVTQGSFEEQYGVSFGPEWILDIVKS